MKLKGSISDQKSRADYVPKFKHLEKMDRDAAYDNKNFATMFFTSFL